MFTPAHDPDGHCLCDLGLPWFRSGSHAETEARNNVVGARCYTFELDITNHRQSILRLRTCDAADLRSGRCALLARAIAWDARIDSWLGTDKSASAFDHLGFIPQLAAIFPGGEP